MKRKIAILLTVLLLFALVSINCTEEVQADTVRYELVENGGFNGSYESWSLSEYSQGSPDENGNRYDSTHTNTSDGSGCIETYVEVSLESDATQMGNWTQSIGDIKKEVIVNGAFNCTINDITEYDAENITATARVSVNDTTIGWKQIYSKSTYWDDLGEGSTGWNNFHPLNKDYTPVGKVNKVSVELYVDVITSGSQQVNCSLRADDISVKTNDTAKPEIQDTTTRTPTTGGSFNVTANVTDNAEVDTVWLRYKLESSGGYGKWFNQSMKPSTNYWLNISVWNNATGIYYSIEANDTSNNWNSSSSNWYDVEDTIAPTIYNVTGPSTQETGGYVNISADVEDNHEVGKAWVNITHPNGTSQNESMSLGGSGLWYYNSTYTSTGTYDYIIWANDTSDNWAKTSIHNFKIEDTTAPKVSNVSALPDPQGIGGWVNITAQVNDIHEVKKVSVNITYPDSSHQNVSMNRSTDDLWYYNSTYTSLGTCNYTVWANDTSDNWNSSSQKNFTIKAPPTANDDQNITDEDTAVLCDVLANDTASEGSLDPSTVTVTSGPAHGSTSVNGTTGEIRYMPDTNYSGLDSFNYTVDDTDGITSNIATVNITVNEVNDAPLAKDDSDSCAAGGDVWTNVTINDVDDNDDLNYTSITIITPPSDGSIATTNHTTGEIQYKPNTNYSCTDNYTYKIEDGAGKADTANVTITIYDDAPPEITDVDAKPDPQETDRYVNITANVTDNAHVNEVYVNITYPNSTFENVSMDPGIGDEWYHESNYTLLGNYTYRILAQDDSNNWNISDVHYFEIVDLSPPQISDVMASPDYIQAGGHVNITANVSDNYNLGKVCVNISYPSGGYVNNSMVQGQGGQWYYNSTYHSVGIHYYVIAANDTSNNWDTTATGAHTFEIVDPIDPKISNVSADPNQQKTGGPVNITADITDNAQVDEVWLNITHPNSMYQNVSMDPGTGDKWYFESNYTVLGTYHYVIYANDTAGNLNHSREETFLIEDTLEPEIDNISASPDPQEPGRYVNITADITDNHQLDEVWVNITGPNGTYQNVSMNSGLEDGWYHNSTYYVPGSYEYRIWANDTSNNRNRSTGQTFEINDTISPKISDVKAVPNVQVIGEYVNITANITDNHKLKKVKVDIYYPGGNHQNVSMDKGPGDRWYYNETYTELGTYDYTIWANDTSKNWNTSSGHDFTIMETDPPDINNVEVTPQEQNVGRTVNITAKVTDTSELKKVWVNITYPDGEHIIKNMTKSQYNMWYYNSTYSELGKYDFTVLANDTWGNQASSSGHNFLVVDSTAPEINEVMVSPDPQETEGYVNISANITDDHEVGEVWVNITKPDGTHQNRSMVSNMVSLWFYNSTYTVPGTYEYTIWANDTSGNVNTTEVRSFDIVDIEAPVISDVVNSPETQGLNGYVNISASVTDNHRVGEVWINITDPDGDHYNLTMAPSQENSWYYNSTYTELGEYSYAIWADDTVNNWNSSSGHTFVIEDSIEPEISNVSALPNKQGKGGHINITADITDNDQLEAVWINIVFPGGDEQNSSMEPGPYDGWYYNSHYDELGVHDYTICAKDTGDNWNATIVHSFEIEDIEAPEISDVVSTPGTQEPGDHVNITAAVTDDDHVSHVLVNITGPDGHIQNKSMESGSGDIWYYNSTYNTSGIHGFTIVAKDPSNNWNSSTARSFEIEEKTPPNIQSVVAFPEPQDTGGHVNITAEVTHEGEISGIWLVIDLPGGDRRNISMNSTPGELWYYNSTYSKTGMYGYEILARDASSNWNTSGGHYFRIEDTIRPGISNMFVSPDPQETGDHVNITAEVRDNHEIEDVWINLIYPDGTHRNESMKSLTEERWYYNSTYSHPGTYSYTICVKDSSDNWNSSGEQTFGVDESKGSASSSSQDGYLWLLFLIIIGSTGAAAYVYTQYLGEEEEEAIIDEIFLIGNDAMLIAHETRRLRPDMDEDVMAGMLTAIQNFIKDSFKDEDDWSIDKLEFQDNKIVIKRGEYVYIAVKYSGELTDEEIGSIQETIEDIEDEYEEELEDWDGDMEKLRGAREKLKQIFQEED